VASIFTKNVGWDRYVEKFGFVTTFGLLFFKLLESSGDEVIEGIGKELEKRLPKEMSQFWFKRVDVDSLLLAVVKSSDPQICEQFLCNCEHVKSGKM
jgi:hypothetical protein